MYGSRCICNSSGLVVRIYCLTNFFVWFHWPSMALVLSSSRKPCCVHNVERIASVFGMYAFLARLTIIIHKLLTVVHYRVLVPLVEEHISPPRITIDFLSWLHIVPDDRNQYIGWSSFDHLEDWSRYLVWLAQNSKDPSSRDMSPSVVLIKHCKTMMNISKSYVQLWVLWFEC